LLRRKFAETHSVTAIYRSLLSNVIRFPSIPGILQNIPCVTSSQVSVTRRCCAVIRCCRAPAEPGKIRCVVPSSLRSLILNNFHLATVSQVGRKFTREFTPARPTSGRNVSTSHSCSLQTAFPRRVKNEGGKKKRKKTTKNGQEIKIANRDWNFQRQPSVIHLFVFCSRKVRRPETPRRGGEQWVPSFIHAKRPMAYFAI